jgi:hypothetical protein
LLEGLEKAAIAAAQAAQSALLASGVTLDINMDRLALVENDGKIE